MKAHSRKSRPDAPHSQLLVAVLIKTYALSVILRRAYRLCCFPRSRGPDVAHSVRASNS